MPCGVDTVGVRCECVYMGFVLTWFRARRVRPGSSHVALTSLITSPAHSGRSGYPAGPARGAYPRRHGVPGAVYAGTRSRGTSAPGSEASPSGFAHNAYSVNPNRVAFVSRRMIYRFISRYHANRIRFDPVVSAGRRVGMRGARAAAVKWRA